MIYLRSVQGIPLARLSHVLRDLFGLDISEGALVNNREVMDLSNDIMGEASATLTLRRFTTPHKRIADKLLSRRTLWEKHLQPLLAPVMRDLPNT